MLSHRQSTKFKVMQLNAENLFLFFDFPMPSSWKELKESAWQSLSRASVPNKPLKKALSLADCILDVLPEVIALNEVGGEESLQNFNKYFLDDRYQPYLIEGNSDRGIDVGYLVRRDLNLNVELISHKDREINFLYPHEKSLIPKKRSHLFSRDCSELRILDSKGQPQLIFFLVHLKSKLDLEGIDPYGNLRRAAEVETLVEIYKESKKNFKQVHRMVLGDFNGIAREMGREPAFDKIYNETDLLNVLEIAGLDEEFSTTQVQFLRTGGRELLQFDYIFLSEGLREKLITDETYVYRYKNDLGIHAPLPKNFDEKLLMPSDHYPVIATLDLELK